jgi:hypothetical protein
VEADSGRMLLQRGWGAGADAAEELRDSQLGTGVEEDARRKLLWSAGDGGDGQLRVALRG